jgi:hypothetical protein
MGVPWCLIFVFCLEFCVRYPSSLNVLSILSTSHLLSHFHALLSSFALVYCSSCHHEDNQDAASRFNHSAPVLCSQLPSVLFGSFITCLVYLAPSIVTLWRCRCHAVAPHPAPSVAQHWENGLAGTVRQ